MPNTLSPAQMTGQSDTHIVSPAPRLLESTRLLESNTLLESTTSNAFKQLQAHALQDGFELTAASSFRSFNRQLLIWNNKFSGKRAILDRHSQEIDPSTLSDEDKVFAILHWSMLPGASRHHWGTEIDVFDKRSLPDGYQLQLIPSEYEQGGCQAKFRCWLDTHMAQYGFFKPYSHDRGGVAIEPWHISFAPQSDIVKQQYHLSILESVISHADILGKSAILANLEKIYQQFIINVSAASKQE